MADTYQKLLTFSIGSEDYGASILKIKEVIGVMNIIPIPRAPDFIKGMINLRGKIIPVMDLRIKFGMDARKYDEETCIIIIEVAIHGCQKLFGIIVDKVSEVVAISDEQIEPPPEYGENSKHNSILGIGKIRDKILIILDIEVIFACEDVMTMLKNVKGLQKMKETQNV